MNWSASFRHGLSMRSLFSSLIIKQATKCRVSIISRTYLTYDRGSACKEFAKNTFNPYSKHHNSFASVLPARSYCVEAKKTEIPLTKKRSIKKKYSSEIDTDNFEEGRYPVVAFSTAKEYDLEKLVMALKAQNLYAPQKLSEQDNIPDVLLTVAKYRVGHEPRHIFFFREGTIVLWNCNELETSNVLTFLKNFEEEPYDDNIVIREREIMSYKYQQEGKKCQLLQSSFMLSPEPDNILERYTFSNAIAQSVKLGVWEATLDNYADSIASVTEDLERGRPLNMTREEVLRKTGSLYLLRHHINLESDLLDTPDFYWEQEELERLYTSTILYFSLARRTKVLNEKVSHCSELVELVAAQLSDRHHVRLEWMIIILIMVEVGFETLHFLERYWHAAE